jgi:hypothetical protein
MSDNVKDVQEQYTKDAVDAEDNVKLLEMNRGYRIAKFNEDNFLARRHKIKSIRIYDKSILALSRYGDELLTRTRNRLMKDPDQLTYDEQLRILTDRGLWSSEREREMTDVRTKAKEIQEERNKILSKIKSAKNKKETEELRKKDEEIVELFKDIYIKYFELTNLNMIYFSDTIEVQAETAQRKGWIVSCVCLDKGDDEYNPENRIWKDVDELEKDLTIENLQSLISECVMFWEFSGVGGESFFEESLEGSMSESNSEAQKS